MSCGDKSCFEFDTVLDSDINQIVYASIASNHTATVDPYTGFGTKKYEIIVQYSTFSMITSRNTGSTASHLHHLADGAVGQFIRQRVALGHE
eukprot:6214167-Pleurochrysis_carterae.AAC.3